MGSEALVTNNELEDYASLAQSGSVPPSQLQDAVESAARRRISRVGKYFHEQLTVRDESRTVFDLEFAPVLDIDRVVELPEEEEVENSNYSLNQDEGTLEFDSGYADDQLFNGATYRVIYTPKIFKDLETQLGFKAILNRSSVVTEDESQSPGDIQNRVDNLVKDINSRTSPRKFKDARTETGSFVGFSD